MKESNIILLLFEFIIIIFTLYIYFNETSLEHGLNNLFLVIYIIACHLFHQIWTFFLVIRNRNNFKMPLYFFSLLTFIFILFYFSENDISKNILSLRNY